MSRELHPEITKEEKLALFLRGAELFDEGRFFEAHEPWEEIWRSSDPEPRDLYQGLVQVAAGLHIWLDRGTSQAARRVLARGHARLSRDFDAPELPEGWIEAIASLRQRTEPWIDWLESTEGTAPPLPRLR